MTKTIVGNWKMHGSLGLVETLVPAVASFAARTQSKSEIVICPPAPLLPAAARRIEGSFLSLGAQDVSAHAEGAYTGDVSASMLAEVGCRYVIVGHSERRAQYRELNETVKAKAEAAIAAGLIPIICVGEMLAQRESGMAIRWVSQQVKECAPSSGQFLLAYEPVWAIGSGKVPGVAEIGEMHAHILSLLPEAKVLYGGSVKAANAADILAVAGVSGLLVGGASLVVEEFCGIIGMTR
ncbi:MAG: triose-phosphate isomerase [Alphaproteobacteria bacterium]|nr:triose-phosphate isomerase [Alphaproteobacteria bacterium]